MRKVIVLNNLSLDGVMQAPGRPDEDTRGGFEHGGWAAAYNDAVMGQTMAQGMSKKGDLLFGRRTYEDFFKVWPNRKDNPFSPVLDNTRKYVASTTLREPLPWKNSTLLQGDAADAVARLKAEDGGGDGGGGGGDIMILGSGVLVQSLMRRNLVDGLTLLIYPLVLGKGRRMFSDDAPMTKFRLEQSVVTTTGVIIATYSAA